jgi:hypothetical protein
VKCPGPAFCPFANERRFREVLVVIALLLVLMAAVAFGAILKGKDGVITSAVCTAMTAVTTTILVGGLHRHKRQDHQNENTKGGDTNDRPNG